MIIFFSTIMPNKSSMEVYESIRKLRPDVKVLFMSGYTRDIIHKSGIVEEGLDFISNPISPATLLRKAGGVLDRQGLLSGLSDFEFVYSVYIGLG